jgi:hypothetical protein
MVKVTDRRNQALGGQRNQRSLSSVTDIGVHWSGVANGTMGGHEGYWEGTLGWGVGGYHYAITKDGTILWNYNLERITNGVGGHNSTSAHVMYEGGHGAPMNDAQKKSLKYVINELMKPKLPNLKRIRGHNEFPDTARYKHSTNSCPGINMNDFRAYLNDGSVKVSTPSKPAPSKPNNNLYGAKLVKNERAKYTVTASNGIKVRNAPSTKATHTGTLKKGQSINYDQVYEGNGYRWLAYDSHKGRRYLPYRPLSGKNEQWGYFGNAPTNKPKPKKKTLHLPKSVKTWRVYRPNGPYTKGNEIHLLTPSAFKNGITYEILEEKGGHVYIINTQVKGRVAIYAGPDTAAVIK